MKLRKKLMLIAMAALMALPFNAFAEEGEEALALSDKYATEAGIELMLNKPISGEDIIPVITPEGEPAVKGEVTLQDSGKKLLITMPQNAPFELDKKYNINVIGITDGENLLSFKTDLTLNMLFKDDFESYADTAELLTKWPRHEGAWQSVPATEDEVMLEEKDGNKRLVLKTERKVANGNDGLLINTDIEANATAYDSYILSYDVENARNGLLITMVNNNAKYTPNCGTVIFGQDVNTKVRQTRVFYNGGQMWNNGTGTPLSNLGNELMTVTQVSERRSSAPNDVLRIYYNGEFIWSIPEDRPFKYSGSTGTPCFANGCINNTDPDNYLYLDNIRAYKPAWENETTASGNISISNLKITGIPSDNTWGEGVNLKCEFNCDAKNITKTSYTWYASTNHSAAFPAEWTEVKTAAEDDTYAMTADDSDKYIACRIEQYIESGEHKISLQTLDTLPVFKISAPVAQDVKFTYDKETMKLKLNYTYIDYNNDPEEGTAFLWEESSDKNTWTALLETTDTVTLTENDTEKYIRCTVTVKNAAQMGNEAEPVTVVYTLPFKPTATVSVKGNGKVGSRLTATYEYFDENGDKEDGSLANWYRIKNGNKESAGQGLTYIVKSADAGYKIVFGYTPKNTEFPTTGDEVFSDEIKISEQSSGGSSGGSSSGGGGGSYTMPVKETKPADKTNTEKIEKETFPDMKGHWAEKEITALKDAGLINGKENGYCPEDAVTRAEWITMLLRAVGTKTDGNSNSTFSDVSTSDWYFGAVETAYKEGYISGDGEGFRPNDKITREEMAKIIISVYEKKLGETEKASLDSFSDKSEISAWANEFVEKAVNLKLMSGVDSEHFMPLKSATRAEAGVIIYRFYNMLSAR